MVHIAVLASRCPIDWWGYCGIPTNDIQIWFLALAEVDLDGLLARFVRYDDLLWHIASFLFIFVVFVLSIPHSHSQFCTPGARVDN